MKLSFWLSLFCISFSLLGNSASLFSSEKHVIWLTGLPCSGKSSIAEKIHELVPNSTVLDGDLIRKTLNKDLRFTPEDRAENLRRVTEITKIALHSSPLVIVACISPSKKVREYAENELQKFDKNVRFSLCFVDAPLELCIKRDVKGMYKKALSGDIPKFTGVSAPYELPVTASVICNTDQETILESAEKILSSLSIVSPHKPHALFIGRWAPFHKGHFAIMEKVYKEDPSRPLMIFVRNTKVEHWSAIERKEMVEIAMKKMKIPATVMIIPDIDSVNWGRGVGYTPRMIDVDVAIKNGYSGTKIREMLHGDNDSWKDFVCPGVDEYLLNLPN